MMLADPGGMHSELIGKDRFGQYVLHELIWGARIV